MLPLYLDFNATTPVDPRVLDAMLPWLRTPSNAGSRTHGYGQQAKNAVDAARAQVAAVLGSATEDVVFTSGATESNNLAILGLREIGKRSGRTHILSTTIEHKAVLEPLKRLSCDGFEIELVPVSCSGCVHADDVLGRVRQNTLLVSVMHANNETGILQPVHEIAAALEKTIVLFHTDAAQTFGKESSLRSLPYDFASVSGHKIYGPQGVGALSVRRQKLDRRDVVPLVSGGGQERGIRPGTVPVALVVGLGAAADLASSESAANLQRAAVLKERLLTGLAGAPMHINGDQALAQPHVLNISFTDVDSEALMMALRDTVAVSNGSACTSSVYQPSHVLKAMGFDDDRVASAIRFSWGRGIDEIPVQEILDQVRSLRC